jgi:hypothetical protein
MLVYKNNKSTIHLHVIPVMKCGCVLGIRKKEVGNTKRKDKDNQELAARVVSQW